MWPFPDIRLLRLAGADLTSGFTGTSRAIVSRDVVVLMLACTIPSTPAAAQDASHGVITTIDLKMCKSIRKNANGTVWRCPGLPGYPIQFAEVDDRTFLSFGPAPEKRRASHQTLTVPNTLFPAAEKRATIEWRVALPPEISKTPPPSRPYAAIVR